MTSLGKCLTFCLKYAPEIRWLETATESDMVGLEYTEEMEDKLWNIGQKAHKEAGEFLMECHQKAFAHLNAVAKVRLTGDPTLGMSY